MRVGVNYPWFDYGWDFGLGPPAWRGDRATPRWLDRIDEHLAHFRRLEIAVVRWFVLADGLTYGTESQAPELVNGGLGRWQFDPPPVDDLLVEHFEELLTRFDGIQLLPVLVDFHFCAPGLRVDPGWVKQGRADAIRDPVKRTQFLDAVLDPLLAASARHPDAIYAWELINEPDWITRGWHPNPFAKPPIPELAMLEFLDAGKERIRAAGFKSTVGFASAHTLRRSGVTADINQFHYYPGGATRLERHTFDPTFPGIIGEIATSGADIWPDLPDGFQSIIHRLRLAADLGYPLVLPWSFLSHDRHTDWSVGVERDIRLFATET